LKNRKVLIAINLRSNPYPVVESRLSAVKVGGRSIPESTIRTIFATVNAAFRRGGAR